MHNGFTKSMDLKSLVGGHENKGNSPDVQYEWNYLKLTGARDKFHYKL